MRPSKKERLQKGNQGRVDLIQLEEGKEDFSSFSHHISVTRFGELSPLWPNFISLGHTFEHLA